MNKYFDLFMIFLGIGFWASGLNGVLCGICVEMDPLNNFGNTIGAIFLSVICSLFFSIPAVAVVLIMGWLSIYYEKRGMDLLRIIMQTALVVSILAAIIFCQTIGKEFKQVNYVMGACIVCSAQIAILKFRNKIKSIE